MIDSFLQAVVIATATELELASRLLLGNVILHAVSPLLGDGMSLGQTYLSWIPVWSTAGWLAIATIAVSLWIGLQLGWGRPLGGPHLGMMLVRGAAVALLIMILLGPTIVDEQPGNTHRPLLTYLFDGSSSMMLGKETTRWQQGLAFVDSAQRAVGGLKNRNCQAFRFGHRLQPLAAPRANGIQPSATIRSGESVILDQLPAAEASDSRLADALRQLLPLVDPRDNAGVVLLSDGRVRATESVETLARYFGELGIPIHVVPVGEAQGAGDVAIVSLVGAADARKFTENVLQVFFRSFGYTGKRTTVRLVRAGSLNDLAEETIASIPITLTGGAQSASLTFRVESAPTDLVAVIDPLPTELTERNNRVATRIDIDRTKVRVLYIEGDSNQQSLLGRLTTIISPSAPLSATSLRDLLHVDEDIECVTLASAGGRSRPVGLGTNPASTLARFPQSRSELFAYDCIVLSNVSPTALEEEDHQRIAQWVDGRGGGLIVCGTESLRPEDWTGSPLADVLPFDLSSLQFMPAQEVPVRVTAPKHPIWRLHLEEQRNAALFSSMPELSTGLRELVPRSESETLAVSNDEWAVPLLVAQRYGRGRVLVSTADLAGQAIGKLGTAWGSEPSVTLGKFWRNMVYWVTEGSAVGRRRLVAESDKRFYRPGDALNIVTLAYDESARKTQDYRIYAMFEPVSLDDMTTYSPILWPENLIRDSGEVGPRIAWGEELLIPPAASGDGFQLGLQLSESTSQGDGGLRIELTAYEGADSESTFGHGTQVDSTSLQIQILSDPFEQQNPLPNHDLLARVAALSGGKVLQNPQELAELIRGRVEKHGEPKRDLTPAWSRWWMLSALIGLLTTEWIWRRMIGMA